MKLFLGDLSEALMGVEAGTADALAKKELEKDSCQLITIDQ